MRKIEVFLIVLIFIPRISKSQDRFTGSVKSAGPAVNSAWDEQNPVLSPDGSILYFTRVKHPANSDGIRDPGDIWFCKRGSDGAWLPAENAGPVWNNREYNSIIGFFDQGKGAYLTGQYDPSGNPSPFRGISVSYYSAGHWTYPVPVEVKYYVQNTEHINASLSPDGTIMVFSLESYNSRGAEDLYVSFKRHDGSWTDIQNLGPVINTPNEEMTPFISANNKTLIFASNGHKGSGSFDLFSSNRLDDTWNNWTEPVNLGATINTNGRELYFYPDYKNQIAYFCSTMNSDGYGDIKTIAFRPADSLQVAPEIKNITPDTAVAFIHQAEKYVISGKVLSSKDRRPVEGTISIFLPSKVSLGEISTDPNTGAYTLEIASRETFLVKVSAKGFLNIEETIESGSFPGQSLIRDYYLEPLEEGRIFRLDNVLFKQSTSILLDSSNEQLDLVYETLKNNPDISIELAGYTDNQGDARKNLELSEDRVNVVKDYIINRGIDASRVTGRGYGAINPVASNASEATRRLNRRVEFRVIRKNGQ